MCIQSAVPLYKYSGQGVGFPFLLLLTFFKIPAKIIENETIQLDFETIYTESGLDCKEHKIGIRHPEDDPFDWIGDSFLSK